MNPRGQSLKWLPHDLPRDFCLCALLVVFPSLATKGIMGAIYSLEFDVPSRTSGVYPSSSKISILCP